MHVSSNAISLIEGEREKERARERDGREIVFTDLFIIGHKL